MKKFKKTSLLVLVLIALMQVKIFADTLNIDIKADKEKINVGDKVKITVSWDKGMQAADFILNYDTEKLEFVKSDLKEDYINNSNGKLRTAWFSMDDTDKTKIEYIFEAKQTGTTELETKVNGGFATGSLLMPTGYNEGKLRLEINNANIVFKVLKITIIIAMVLILIILILRKTRINKTGKINK